MGSRLGGVVSARSRTEALGLDVPSFQRGSAFGGSLLGRRSWCQIQERDLWPRFSLLFVRGSVLFVLHLAGRWSFKFWFFFGIGRLVFEEVDDTQVCRMPLD